MRYRVTIIETISYKIQVEAEDEDAAETKAEEALLQSENPFEDFASSVEDRDIPSVEPLDDADADPPPRVTRYYNGKVFLDIVE